MIGWLARSSSRFYSQLILGSSAEPLAIPRPPFIRNFMRCTASLCLVVLSLPALAQEKQPLETPYTPFDFDNYRRTPIQARQSSPSWASRDSTDLQRALIAGERGRKNDISAQAAALFPNPQEIPLQKEPEPLPTPNELTDQITVANHGETTKGQRDLLARGRVAEELDLSSMSDSDYELYVARVRAEKEEEPPQSGEALLRPMPSLINTKTGGPPHGYAVSQAGVGTRAEPRNGQNPFEDLIRALRLDKPVTKGTDPLPSPQSRLAVAATAPGDTVAPEASPSASASTPTAEQAKP